MHGADQPWHSLSACYPAQRAHPPRWQTSPLSRKSACDRARKREAQGADRHGPEATRAASLPAWTRKPSARLRRFLPRKWLCRTEGRRVAIGCLRPSIWPSSFAASVHRGRSGCDFGCFRQGFCNANATFHGITAPLARVIHRLLRGHHMMPIPPSISDASCRVNGVMQGDSARARAFYQSHGRGPARQATTQGRYVRGTWNLRQPIVLCT